jgi:hypothetical protein
VRETQVYEAVQNHAKAPQPVVTFTNSLETLAGSYVSIHNPDHEKWNEYTDSTRKALEVLNLFAIRPLRPLMLAIAQRFTKKNETEAAFRFCVSLSVRLMIAGSTRTGTVEEGLAEAAHKVFVGEIENAATLRDHLKPIFPNDDQFKLAFQIATISNGKLARYYLRSLEMVAKDESEPWHIPNDDKNVINLEHVLPEKALNNWPQFSRDQVRLYFRRIGNLALLRATDNSDMKSLGFEKKKSIYAQSPYVLTQHVADSETWTNKEITDRQQVLAEYALKAWPSKWK